MANPAPAATPLVPGLPSGFVARGVDPHADAAPVTELCNAASNAESGANELDITVQEESYRTPGFDPGLNAVVVLDPGGRHVATAEYWDNEAEHATPFLYARLHPDVVASADGAAIGAALLAWADGRGRHTLELAAPDLRVTLSTTASAANPAMQHILEAGGFGYVRSSWQMVIDLGDEPPAEPAWPPGVSVRSVDPVEAEQRAILDVQNDAFADHYGFVPMSFGDFIHYNTRIVPYEPALWRVATDGDELVGIALNMAHRPGMEDTGWVGTLGVRRAWRRRGIGEALLRDAFARFHERGKRRVGLGVDASNLTGATRLYERVGMRVAREGRSYERVLRDGREVRTVALPDDVA
jgi:ribosomal protein S18 acetylase RimI-like enzyme